MTQGPPPTGSAGRVVVVGAGVAGLTAARDLALAGRRVLLLEASAAVGGKLALAEVAGVPVDVGAEAVLARRPEGTDLARAVGLAVEHPAVVASQVWARGALRRLPRTLMGAPLDLDDLRASGVLTTAGLERAALEPDVPMTDVGPDVSVGDLLATRFGDEVVDLLVEPLLGGVYAGHARRLSVRAAVPQLLAALAEGPLLGREALPGTHAVVADGPVFAAVPGGMGRLPQALVDDLRGRPGVEVRTRSTVRELRRTPEGFELVVGDTRAPEVVAAADVVLALPAAPAARLLAGLAPSGAAALATVEHASVAVVTLALPAAEAPDLVGSGFLVPPREGLAIKASTFSASKWGWVRRAGAAAPGGPVVHLRTSVGRHGEESSLQVDDDELVARSLADLSAVLGPLPPPVDAQVRRWGGGLPQYAVGHLDLVARVRRSLRRSLDGGPGRLAVCGAAYDGVGIPAVVASAHRAAAEVLGERSGPPGTMGP